jgi:5-oxoprolinase (ATP-hydrolysing) subunit A
MRIDLNCDMGESFGAYTIGADEQVMSSITSANIACGFHGGDPGVMRRTVRMARDAGVSVGAHPGFQDLAGFGRREVRMTP